MQIAPARALITATRHAKYRARCGKSHNILRICRHNHHLRAPGSFFALPIALISYICHDEFSAAKIIASDDQGSFMKLFIGRKSRISFKKLYLPSLSLASKGSNTWGRHMLSMFSFRSLDHENLQRNENSHTETEYIDINGLVPGFHNQI